jgi:mannose-6-phosphate isomerase
VLSVAQALSVQAHPDKALAEALHARRPDLYKDDNHKPELACALTPFEAMCGFRSPTEIAAHVAAVPELRAMVGDARAGALVDAAAALAASTANTGDAPPPARLDAAFKGALRDAFTAFMSAPADAVATHTAALAARIAAAPPAAEAAADADGRLLAPEAVVARLLRDFPGDVGVFAPYWLNTLRLRPGEAVFLGANDPHAYLAGDCMEVMACR